MYEPDFIHVTAVRHLGDHRLWLRFHDGAEGIVDLADRLGQAPPGSPLEALRDPDLFARARLQDGYTVAWPNGVDLAPESLYERLEATAAAPKRSLPQSFDGILPQEAAQLGRMPEISRFLGIVIRMFYDEHEAPHFHAQYAEYAAAIAIRDGMVKTRGFPPRALRLVLEWHELHRDELLANWARIRAGQQPVPITPLE